MVRRTTTVALRFCKVGMGAEISGKFIILRKIRLTDLKFQTSFWLKPTLSTHAHTVLADTQIHTKGSSQ